MKEAKLEKAVHKILENEAMWAYYGHPSDGYSIAFYIDYDGHGEVQYLAALFKNEMPCFHWENFKTVKELAEYVLSIQPDMRRWRRSFK